MYLKVYTCSIVLLVTFIVGAAGDFCFRNRNPSGPFGQCDGIIANKDTAAECCRAGGAGWTMKRNGKRCGPACSGNEQNAVPATTQPPTTTQPPAEVKLCFRNREPNGRMGNCGDLMGERTREDCCRQGGKGWTDRQNGKRCEDACDGVDDGGPIHYCFGRRSARGRCFQSQGEKTRLQCCQDGGAGWTSNSNGRPCQSACEEPPRQIIHGGWSEWEDWGQCTASCGEGTQTRHRRCNNPRPENGGDDCVGENSEIAICDEGPCPIHGGWGSWGNAGECSATCYYKGRSVYRQQRRRCNNPVPQYGGDPCRGARVKNVVCLDLPHCPVDGGWSDYGEWSECTQTCEEGTQTRTRTCTNPRPQYGGRDCEGIDTESQICRNRRVCPVHGGWSDWGRWSPCDSPRCGVDGTRFRSRECTNPKPKNRGNYCVGRIIDRETCSKCPVQGGWSEWSPWGPCSGNCRPGDFRIRYRICNDPLPQNGGFCEGSFKETGECRDLNPCPYEIDGEGSGSGDGSGRPSEEDIFPCDDEDTCNYGAGNDEAENSFSYSLGGSIVVHDDVTPTPKPCVEYDLYSIEEYNDQVACQENQDGGVDVVSLSFDYYDDNNNAASDGGQPSVSQGPVEVDDGEDSDSYSFDDGNENPGNGGAPQVEENNGDSDSYSFDEDNPGNGAAPQVEENNGDSDSYSFDEEEDNPGNGVAPQVEENNGDSDSYSFDEEEDNPGNGVAPQVEENNGDSDSYSFDEEEDNPGNGVAPQVEENNGDSGSYSFDEEEDNPGNGVAPQVEENNGDSDSYSFDGNEDNADPAEDNAPNEDNVQEEDYSYSV